MALEKKLVIVKYVKLGMMLTVVVLCTLMISTIDLSQSLVFAQNTTSITPAPELAGSSDDDSTSNDNDNNESNGSSDDNGNDNDSSSEYSNNDNDGNDVDSDSQQDTLSSEEDETEDEFEQTNPLLEQIRNSVKGALSGTGMAIP